MLRKALSIIFVLLSVMSIYATHNRAGEITYRHLGGNNYEITILTCTRFEVEADRDTLELDFGDDSPLIKVLRVNGPDANGNGVPDGVFIGNDIQRNLYVVQHTYPGPGQYILYTEDPNRNEGVLNIPNSVQVGFSISSMLVIQSGTNGHNNSPILNNPPKGDACVNQLYLYNPLASDPDGDSLSYELVESTTFNNQVIGGYLFPDEVEPGPDNVLEINPVTGELTWDAAQLVGEYNVVIQINEWRNGDLVGFVKRDMQINALTCVNQPPIVADIADTCIVAGTVLSLGVTATDPNGDIVTLEAFGEPFDLNVSPAQFNQSIPGGIGALNWISDCEHVRLNPYVVFLKGTDNGQPVQLSNFNEFSIQIVAPPIENPSATPLGNMVQLDWDNSVCENATGYKVYRRIGSFGFVPDHCETGVPEFTGYELIANVEGWQNSEYLDADNVPFGNDVCYLIVTCFEDGSESIASEEFCTMLEMEVPVITHVSVGVTDVLVGEDTIRWYPPLELDTTMFTGPYSYEILRADGFGNPNVLLETTNPTTFLDVGPFERIYSNLDTETQANNYIINFFNDGNFIVSSNTASSVLLSITSSDNSLALSWTESVPWINNSYEIFRDDGSGTFEFLDSTTEMTYVDSGLVNGQEYCYFVRSIGAYDTPLIPDVLINYSQESCSRPFDSVPPCPPEISIEGECELENYVLTWNNPNNTCADDVVQYNVYYSPTLDGQLELVYTSESANDTVFVPEDFTNVIGCYVVTALDSLLAGPDGILNQNESVFSDTICIDSCPVYELPNVISPNGDGNNDVFTPFPGFRYIDSIDLTIFNRWGEPVYKTTNPEINWDGQHQDPLVEYFGSGAYFVPDGTYYYVCIVNQLTLQGIVPFTLTGSFTMFREGSKRFE